MNLMNNKTIDAIAEIDCLSYNLCDREINQLFKLTEFGKNSRNISRWKVPFHGNGNEA